MGVVYRARHRELGKLVAIKVLQQSLVTDEVVLKRFQREAQAASRPQPPQYDSCIQLWPDAFRCPLHRHGVLRGARSL